MLVSIRKLEASVCRSAWKKSRREVQGELAFHEDPRVIVPGERERLAVNPFQPPAGQIPIEGTQRLALRSGARRSLRWAQRRT